MKAITASQRNVIFYTLVWAVIILTAFAYFACPWMSDDYWYKGDIIQFGKMSDGSYSLWDGIIGTINYHFLYDNARLANVSGTFFMLLPHWVNAALVSAAFAAMVLLMIRLARITPKHFGALTVLISLMLVVWPWYEYMYGIIHGFNYILASALFLWAVKLFFDDNQPRWWWMSLLGLLVGLWHEGFGVALVGGALAVLVLRRTEVSKERIAMIVGAALGLSYLLLAPSLAVRVGSTVDLNSPNIIVLKAHIFNVLYLFVWLGMLCFRKWRKVALADLPVFTLVVVLGLLVLSVLVGTARSAFPGFLMTTVMYAYFAAKISWPKMRIAKIIMCVAAWVFMLVHLVMVARMAVIVSDEWDRAMQLYTSDECKDGVVYMDYTSESKCSPLLLRKIVYYNFVFAYSTCQVHHYMDKEQQMMVVPASLKGYHDFVGTPIPGNAGAKIYKGCVVVKTEDGFPNLGIADLGMGKSPRLLNVREFHGADGCRYLYFDIQYHFWEHFSDGKLRYLDLL